MGDDLQRCIANLTVAHAKRYSNAQSLHSLGELDTGFCEIKRKLETTLLCQAGKHQTAAICDIM